jgi:type III pantothenate kinase
MKLLIDIGNTRSKWALCEACGDILERGFLGDAVLFSDDAQVLGLKPRVEQVWVSCVGNVDSLIAVTEMVRSEFALTPFVVEVESQFESLCNNYKDRQLLGVDRWVAAIGARSYVSSGAVIIVDAGTAATIDVISSDNAFEGGVILPGMEMMHDSLVGRTAGIDSELSRVGSVIGKTTRECVNAGVQYGLVGAIERVISEMLVMLDKPLIDKPRLRGCGATTTIVICGGDADRIQALTSLPMQRCPDLIFRGLHLISNMKSVQ